MEPLSQERLSEDEVNVIANDYNELWRHGAITDKDHGQVEDLIVSHLSLLTEVKRLQAIDQQNDELKKLSEHASRIIDSGMYGGSLRYDPLSWFKKYHKLVNGADTNE